MDVQEADSEKKKDEEVPEKMSVDQDKEIKAEKDGDENEDADSKEEREQVCNTLLLKWTHDSCPVFCKQNSTGLDYFSVLWCVQIM